MATKITAANRNVLAFIDRFGNFPSGLHSATKWSLRDFDNPLVAFNFDEADRNKTNRLYVLTEAGKAEAGKSKLAPILAWLDANGYRITTGRRSGGQKLRHLSFRNVKDVEGREAFVSSGRALFVKNDGPGYRFDQIEVAA